MSRQWPKQIQVKSYAQLHHSTQRDTGLTLDLQVSFSCLLYQKDQAEPFPGVARFFE